MEGERAWGPSKEGNQFVLDEKHHVRLEVEPDPAQDAIVIAWARACLFKELKIGTSLEVLWLRLCASNAGGSGSIPGWETKILHAMWSKN